MIKLSEFIKEGLTVNWGTVFLGWKGFAYVGRELDFDEVKKFAEDWLMSKEEYQDIVSGLLFISSNDEHNVEDILKKLAELDRIPLENEQKKWRYMLLLILIKKLSAKESDYLNSLIELTSFWAMLDFPESSPHVIQGKGNMLSPKEYYSNENYRKLLSKHKEWLKQEYKKISG